MHVSRRSLRTKFPLSLFAHLFKSSNKVPKKNRIRTVLVASCVGDSSSCTVVTPIALSSQEGPFSNTYYRISKDALQSGLAKVKEAIANGTYDSDNDASDHYQRP